MATNLQKIFDDLAGLLRKHAKGLELLDHLENSTAKVKKKTLIMQGLKQVSIGNQPPKKIYLAGIMLHPSYVGFYFMPMYGQPDLFKLSPTLQKARKGKACIHIKSLDPAIKSELNDLLKRGVQCYKKLGWV